MSHGPAAETNVVLRQENCMFAEKNRYLSVGNTDVWSERTHISHKGYVETDKTCKKKLLIISKRQKSADSPEEAYSTSGRPQEIIRTENENSDGRGKCSSPDWSGDRT